MDIKDINKIKKNSTSNRRWTDEELKHLKDMADNGIRPCDLKAHPDILKSYFPGRTLLAIESKLVRLV